MESPETRYAKTPDGVHIAYQTMGDGRHDLVFLPNWFSSVDLFWQNPAMSDVLKRLSSFGRLIVFDQRGTGASDPVAISDLIQLEERATDLLAVLDAARSHRAALIGVEMAAPLAIFFAASHVERTSHLIVVDGTARFRKAVDYPFGDEPGVIEEDVDEVLRHWGTSRLWSTDPMLDADRREREWAAFYQRLSLAPGAAAAMLRAMHVLDVRNVLPSVRVPSVVLHHANHRWLSIDHARFVADAIPDSKLVAPRRTRRTLVNTGLETRSRQDRRIRHGCATGARTRPRPGNGSVHRHRLIDRAGSTSGGQGMVTTARSTRCRHRPRAR